MKDYFRKWVMHWLAFQLTAVQLKTWKIRFLLHDMDKLVLFLIHKDKNKVRSFHRVRSSHHVEGRHKKMREVDWLQAVIDWECARLTKADKPLSAREFMEAKYPEYKMYIEPILIKINL